MDSLTACDDDIAIIGMSCRVSGANTPSELWNNLVSSKECQHEIDRFNIAGFYHKSGGRRQGLTNVRHAYFLDEGVDKFDHDFFSISPREASAMDPQQRLLLEIAYEALENAGIPLEKAVGTDTAVYVGLSTSDYAANNLRDIDSLPEYHSTGAANAMAANRVSYFFDWHGPSMVIDTACSSTATALHQAILGLKTKDTTMALVCGSNLIISPDMFVHMSTLGFLSPSGNCKSFDSSADGYARGEGVTAILLKPFKEALSAEDPVRAVIKGSRVNQDGRTSGITSPSSEAQRRNIEQLYSIKKLDPGSIQYVEAHGTGTSAGDPCELSALNEIFRKSHTIQKLIVGSVKSNIGHLEASAALISIIKTVECLERGWIPPQMHFREPNPNIDFSTIEIPTKTLKWPESGSGVRRAAVNSFGFGGTNGHIVLDHFPKRVLKPSISDRPFLFKVSATSESSLYLLSDKYADYALTHLPNLMDLAHTLLTHRSSFRRTLYFTASSHADFAEKLRQLREQQTTSLARSPSSSKELAFVFTGQGAQWAGMGRGLLNHSPSFTAIIKRCDDALAELPSGPTWTIQSQLSQPPETSFLHVPSVSQVVCTALQIGLVAIWKTWGLKPSVVLGHSSGEIAAAYTAGMLSLRDSMAIAFYRGACMGDDGQLSIQNFNGAMCVVSMNEVECEATLSPYEGRVALAAVNSPTSCTLSGDRDAIDEILVSCKADGIFCRALRLNVAYHSRHMLPFAPSYIQDLVNADISPLNVEEESPCEMFSSVTQRKISAQELLPVYWAQNMVSTVRFAAALKEASRYHKDLAFLEIGPHPALKSAVIDTMAATGLPDVTYFHSCHRYESDFETMLKSAGEMIDAGLPINRTSINRVDRMIESNLVHETGSVLTDLPSYQWDHKTSCWAETRANWNLRHRRFPRHPLLGARAYGDGPLGLSWRNKLILSEVKWVEELIVSESVPLFPAVLLVMLLEAARQAKDYPHLRSCTIELVSLIFVDTELDMAPSSKYGQIETILNLRPNDDNSAFQVEILITPDGSDSSWKKCCTADLRFIAQKHPLVEKLGDLVEHDEALSEQIKILRPPLVQGIQNLQLGRSFAKGYMNQRNVDDDYLMDGNIAALLFKISQTLMLASGPLAKFRTYRIDHLELTQTNFRPDATEFYASTTRLSPIKGLSSIYILDVNGIWIDCQKLETQVQNICQAPPRLESLFFKPRILLDVSQMQTSHPLNIYEALELVTHKWPMSDIGAIEISNNDVDIIRSCLNADKIGARLCFRSISLLRPKSDRNLRRTKIVQSFKQEQFHLILGEMRHVIFHISSLTQYGLVCAKLKSESDRDLLGRHLDFICDVRGLTSQGWILGRPKPWKDLALPNHSLRILTTKEYTFRDSFQHRPFDLTVMEPGMPLTALQVEAWKSNDIIVMDVGIRSVLIDWTGNCLLPWVKALIKHAKNLLWVTQKTSDDPFNSVAGAFIKTIRSEQPTIQASSVVVQDSIDLSSVNGLISNVFDRIVTGHIEGEYIVRDSKVHILRYHPDDDLAASVGVVPYHWSIAALNDNFYTVSIAAVKQALIFSSGHRPSAKTLHGSVWVRVNASVIDHWDNAQFMGHANSQVQEQGVGQFFCGTFLSGANCAFKPGNTVVGWLPEAHKSHLLVPIGQLRLLPNVMAETDALAFCAVYSTALAILQSIGKHSFDKALDIQVSGVLGEALVKLCQARGIRICDDRTCGPAYILAFDQQSGFNVDGNPISLAGRTMSHLLAESLSMMTEERFRLQEAPQCFNLSETQTAFEVASSHLLSTVLVHSGKDQPLEHVIQACPEQVLFRDDGWYILAGGLGGLGRYLMKWMAFKGAAHFLILSRSGHVTEFAESTIQAVQHLGAQIKVVKCDTCDSRAVTDAFVNARKSRPIRGCLNLVLQLANSPLDTMTSEQWDATLQSKVRSSWNLHQATLFDGLDMFIMFSSISSILGNRTQANYAVGNAFQNSLAEYRKSISLPGIAIALGAMCDIGVLSENKDLLQTLRKSGMLSLKPDKLLKIFEAAVLESRSINRTLLVTGLEMFKKLDGTVQSSLAQNQIFWADWPEFGGLFDHESSITEVKLLTLLQRLETLELEKAHEVLCREFVICLGNLLGTDTSDIDLTAPLASYGLDSLNAVSFRYWFFKQLEVDVAVFDILGSKSVHDLVTRVLAKLSIKPQVTQNIILPKPIRHDKRSLQIRPISHSQNRLWFLHNYLSDKTVYNLLLVCRMSSKPDVVRFVKAWSIFMRRHEILHSCICETAEGWQQVLLEKFAFPLKVVEATCADFHGQDQEIKRAAKDYEFNPGSGDVIRGWLLISDSQYRFYLASHHMVWDRASVKTIFKETSTIYKALMCGEAPETYLDPVPYQFVDYAIWQKECMAQDSLTQFHLDYWKHQLAGAPEAVSLLPNAVADTRPLTKQHSSSTVMVQFNSTKTLSLKGLCKANAVTPFMLMVSTLSVLIHRLTNDTDIIIGIADGDRGHPEFDNLVGFTVNMLAIRCKVDPKSSYATVLEQHRKVCFEAYEHRSVPFEYLLQKLDVPRRLSHSPIFQVTVNYQMEGAFPQCDYGNFKFTEYEHFNTNSQSDFSLDIEETTTGEYSFTFTYDTSLYAAAAIHDLAERFTTLTDSILETNASSSIETLNLMTEKDQELMAASLRPVFDQQFSLDELNRDLFRILFERAVAKYPQKTAIIDAHREITYAELDAITTRIARYLVQYDIRKGGRIGVYCFPGLDMVLAIYGILRAGFAYVPLDSDFSENRVDTIVEDAKISVILTDGINKRELIRLSAAGVTITSICYILKSLTQVNEREIQPCTWQTGESETFCCIYTSGSTGCPKGIEIGHQQLRYQMEGYHKFIGTGQFDRLLLASSITFDMSLTSIFGTILHCATMVVAPREARLSSIEMIDFVVKNGVSSCTLTTTQLKMLLSSPVRDRLSKWTSLRSIVIGGEKIPPWVIRDFYSLGLDNASIFNGYGPAESTVCNSLRKLHLEDSERPRVPLAPPLFPAKFYILDEHCNPAPIGVPGELYIGGPTISKGYLNRADLTEAAFLKASSLLGLTHEQGTLYRTRDSFRLTYDGTLEVLGRVVGDRQVKIRGIRIELEEIENVIYQILRDPKILEVSQVSLVAVIYYDINGIDGILAAYLMIEDGIPHQDDQHSLLKAWLRSAVSTLLPIHMRPSAFVVLHNLPKTSSGKIDYQTMLTWPLPEPEAANGNTTDLETSLNKLQTEIAGVWKLVLGLDGNLSQDDDFFTIGGHSLLLMQVQHEIKEHFGVSISLGDMFSNPTIQGFERLVASHRYPRHGLECNGLQADEVNNSNTAHMDNRRDLDGVDDSIDWDVETSLPDLIKPLEGMHKVGSMANIAITGACTMTGSHFLEHILSTTSAMIHCIATEGDDTKHARINVLRKLDHWQLLQRIPAQDLDRLIIYSGSLSHPTLGLTATQVAHLDKEVDAIFQLDSEVSLLKRYESLRASNVDSLKFLISLAHSKVNNIKAIYHLSTWAVPHLQSWTKTKLSSNDLLTHEVEMTNIKPGSDGTLGYLKARWVCEVLLYRAARCGIPVTIFRASMCGGSSVIGVPLDRTDINRRILETSLQTGLVPNFSSAAGGGMSWISVDFLVRSIVFLSQQRQQQRRQLLGEGAEIYHIVADEHIPYTSLPDVLNTGYDGSLLRSASPEQWFEALRATSNKEMAMQAEVLEQWVEAGWVPFPLRAEKTKALLKKASIEPASVDRKFLMRLVVGDQGF